MEIKCMKENLLAVLENTEFTKFHQPLQEINDFKGKSRYFFSGAFISIVVFDKYT